MKTAHLKTFILFFGLLFFNNCDKKIEKIERDAGNLYKAEGDDKELNNAINEAKQNIGIFESALNSNNENLYGFCIKMRFLTETGGEHIWLCDVFSKKNKLYGIIDNVPVSRTDLKLGDTIEIPKSEISDWMFINKKDSITTGGYTIKVIRNRFTKEEQKIMQKESGIKFE